MMLKLHQTDHHHNLSRTGDNGGNVPYTPLNSDRLVGDPRLKKKQINQGQQGDTSLEVPSILGEV